MEKVPVSETDRVSMSTLSLFAGDISGLWDLDVLAQYSMYTVETLLSASKRDPSLPRAPQIKNQASSG